MITLKFPMVLHVPYGGFSLTAAIMDALRAAQWEHFDRLENHEDYSHWLRQDPTLIRIVREFEAQLAAAKLGYKEMRELERTLLMGLRVGEVEICVDIEDNDGMESIHVSGQWSPGSRTRSSRFV